MTRLLIASLEVCWHGNEMFFFHRESGIYFDIFRPYPEIVHLSITIQRKETQVGSCTVWTSGKRERGFSDLFFIGLEDYFDFPHDCLESLANRRNGMLQFNYLTPFFFEARDVIEIMCDGEFAQRFFGGEQRYRRRFIEAVFNDFMANSFFGIEGIELLWAEFLSKHQPSHATIAVMLSVSRQNTLSLQCLCGGDNISNADVIRGNELRDLWLEELDTWRQTSTSRARSSEVFSFRGA